MMMPQAKTGSNTEGEIWEWYNDKHDATNSATSPSRDGELAYGVLLTPFHPRLPALEKSGRLMTGESR
jgi:hypothetical protein